MTPSSTAPDVTGTRRRTYGGAVDELVRAQKPGHGVPPYTRYVNRWMGRRLAAASAVIGLTPNQVTAISAALSLIAFGLLAALPPGPLVAVSVTVLCTLAYAFDAADGQLARLQGVAGPAGEWVDHVTDAARQPLLHLAVLVHLLRIDGGQLSWIHAIPLAYLVVGTVRFLSQILADQLTRNAGARPAAESGRADLRALLQLPADPGTLHLAFLLLVVPAWFVTGYAALFVANLALAVVSFVRRYRQLAALAAR